MVSEASIELTGQTPPAVGVTRLRALSCRAERPPAGGHEASSQLTGQTHRASD